MNSPAFPEPFDECLIQRCVLRNGLQNVAIIGHVTYRPLTHLCATETKDVAVNAHKDRNKRNWTIQYAFLSSQNKTDRDLFRDVASKCHAYITFFLIHTNRLSGCLTCQDDVCSALVEPWLGRMWEMPCIQDELLLGDSSSLSKLTRAKCSMHTRNYVTLY